MNVPFVTSKGSNRLTSAAYYIGLPKHERTMSKKETYALCAERTGYKPTAVKAVFLGLKAYLKSNAAMGNITYIDGIASIRNYCRGAFASLTGPWVKGVNYLMVVYRLSLDPLAAREMICRYGMSEKFGFQAFMEQSQFTGDTLPPAFSEETSRQIDAEVKKLIDDAYADAKKLIAENRDKLETLAKTLIEKETMDGREVESLI